MNNACPECGAVYNVAEKDVGRRIACKRCATALIVAEEGLKREPLEAAVTDNDPVEPQLRRERDEERERGRKRSRADDDYDDDRPPRRSGKRNAQMGELVSKLKGMGDLPTWLYGIGLFLVVYSFFSPQIDKAKVDSRQGYFEDLQTQSTVKDREDKAKNSGNLSESRQKAQKEFKEKELDPAEDDVSYARAGIKRAEWWNVMARLLGFFLISFGSLGFMSAQQPLLQRVAGGVTLLLVLLQVIGGGAMLNVGLGARPG